MDLRRKLLWVFVLYFAEGFPFGIVRKVWPVYFRQHGVSLTDIGLMSLLGLPWTLKVLWSPAVDRYGTRLAWVRANLLVMAAVLAFLPWLGSPGTPALGPVIWASMLVFTFASATQDLAIDAYTVGLTARGEEGDVNGVRVSAYRVALIASGGGLLVLAGTLGWTGVHLAAAVLLAGVAMLLRRAPAECPRPGARRRGGLAVLRQWALRPGAGALIAFILLYKLGDAAMGPMLEPFWLDRGLSEREIGMIGASLGVGATITGALAGGWITDRLGIYRALWVLGLAQAVSNLGYAAAASVPEASAALRPAVYGASLVESFTGGLGTAAFLAFLMSLCDRDHAAVQYAVLSALFALSRDVAGAASGWAAVRLGYASYFGFTFLLALPAYAFLPVVRGWIPPRVGQP